MPILLSDRTKELSFTAGAGNFTLNGAIIDFQTFEDGIGGGNQTYYATVHNTFDEWEVGIGTYTSPNIVSRDTVLDSSNGGLLVNFSPGTKDVFVTIPAEYIANKKTDLMSTNRLLGRGTAGAGVIEEITLGTNLSLTGTTLNAASGGGSFTYVAKIGTYTATASDYTIDYTANTVTINLPTSIGIIGRIYVIKNSGTGVITVDAFGSELIDDALTAVLSTQYESITLQSTNIGWIIL